MYKYIEFNMNLPDHIHYACARLLECGHQAYVVGGAVRDSVLGREVHDYDIATNATPEETKTAFGGRKTIDVGIKYGTVVVCFDEGNVEITTFRVDGDYSDSRRPDGVKLSDSLEDDLSRRDFTMNALAYSPVINKIIDCFGGYSDINNRIIRAVGVPKKRFEEDALRMLRAIRFMAQLEYDTDEHIWIEHDTLKAITRNRHLIGKLSRERVRAELDKILLCENSMIEPLMLMQELGVMSYVIPELSAGYGLIQPEKYHQYDVYGHCVRAAAYMSNCYAQGDVGLTITALLHDIGKPFTRSVGSDGTPHYYEHEIVGADMARDILQRLKYPNEIIDRAARLIRNHMRPFNPGKDIDMWARKLIHRMGESGAQDVLTLHQCDFRAARKDTSEDDARCDLLMIAVDNAINSHAPSSTKDLAISGKDIMEWLHIEPGVMVGKAMRYCMDEVLRNPAHNDKDYLKKNVIGRFHDAS